VIAVKQNQARKIGGGLINEGIGEEKILVKRRERRRMLAVQKFPEQGKGGGQR